MSEKYDKRMRSNLPRYVMTDKAGDIIVSTSDKEAYDTARQAYLDKINQEED